MKFSSETASLHTNDPRPIMSSESRLSAHYAVTRVFAEADSLKEATPKIIEIICNILDWEIGVLWLVDLSAHELFCENVWQTPIIRASPFIANCKQRRFKSGEGLPGRVLAAGKAIAISNAIQDANFPRGSVASLENIRGAIAFPIVLNGKILGVMEFFSRTVREPDPAMLDLMETIGSQLGQFIERKRAEQALRESEEKYRVIATSASDALITIDAHSTIVFVSPAIKKIFGYDPEELCGKSLTCLMPERLRPVHRDGIARYISTGKKNIAWNGVEVPGLKKDGSEVPVEISFGEFTRDGARFFTGVIRDVSQRHAFESELKRREQELTDFVENATIGLHWVQPDGIIKWANKAELELLGYAKEEYIGQPITKFHADPPVISDILCRLERNEMLLEYPARLRCKDGSIIDVLINSSVYRENGKFVHTRCFTHDVTRLKKAENALLRSDQFNRSIIQSSHDCIKTLALDGTLLWINDQGKKALCIDDLSQVIGKSWVDLWQGQDRAAARAAVDAAKAGKPGNFLGTFVTNGKVRWWDVAISPILNSTGQPETLLAVSRDITERTRIDAALAERNRLAALRADSSAALAKSQSMPVALQQCCEALVLHLEVAFARIWTLNEQDNVLELQASAGLYTHLDGPHSRVAVGEFKIGRIAANRKPHLTNAVVDDPEVSDRKWAAKEGMVAFAGYPLLVEGRVVGVMAMFARRALSDSVLTELSPMAEGIAQYIVRRHAEEEVRRSEEQLRTLVDSIPQLAWMAEPDGHIFWYNQRWYKYTGTTAEQMEGWGWQSVHDPKVLPLVLERWKDSLRTITPFEMEFPLRGADGVYRWFLTRVNPVKDSYGRVVRWFGTNTDVDQAKRTKEALQEETRVLELLNDTGRAIASKLDLQELVQTVTDAGTTLSGAKFGAFFYNVINDKGESFLLYTLSGAPREAFEKFGLPRNTPVFNPTFRGEGVVRSGDITKDPRYGTMLPHKGMPVGHLPVRSYLAVPVVSRNGEVIGGLFFGHPEADIFTDRAELLMIGIAAQAATAIDNARLYEAGKREIAQRTLAEEKLQLAKDEAEQANRAKDEFLAIVSHELRTPLTSMLGWTRLLISGGLDETKAAHGIRVIERNVKLQTQLIEDLLDVSRVITGKLPLTIVAVDLVRVISAAIDSIKPAADAKQIKLEPVNESSINTIAGDPGRLQQVFWNLLSNAVKFTPKNGRVDIRITRVESAIHVSVKDTGKGIESDFLPHLFERFRQLDSSTTRLYGGLGLGLAIVRHLVEQHGGRVSARSEGTGKGTEFIVELPIRAVIQAQSPAPDPREIQSKAKPLSGLRILVVEDETDSRDLILTALEMAGASGTGVSSAEDALSYLDRDTPDVIVSDIGMPMKDGYQFIQELRLRDANKGGKIPVLALTAYAREEDRARAKAAGFNLHVAKPIDPAELVKSVAQIAP